MRELVREHEARVGNKAAQLKLFGLIAKVKDDALLKLAADKREEVAEREALEKVVLANTRADFKTLDLEAFKMQVRARKKLHKEASINIGAATSYFNVLGVLVLQLKLNVADDEMRTAAAAKAGGRARGVEACWSPP